MKAEEYIKEKERLSQALNGEEKLNAAITDIALALERNGIDLMPGIAFDVMKFTLETLHLEKFNLPDRR